MAGAVALATLCLVASFRRLLHLRQLSRAAREPEPDDLERRLQAREKALFLTLSRRNVRAFSRVALAGGTGFGVWELTGGAAQLPFAVAAFVAGAAGWGGCQEVFRRIGSLADIPPSTRR